MECPICFEVCKLVRPGKCRHTFCVKCARDLRMCALCREPFTIDRTLPPDGCLTRLDKCFDRVLDFLTCKGHAVGLGQSDAQQEGRVAAV